MSGSAKVERRRGSNKIDMCQGPILPLLARFALPLLITGILQVLFNAADIMVVGKFGSEFSLAAVSSTSSITSLLVNLFIGLSVGTNVLCARYFGAKDEKSLSETVHTSILLSVILGAGLTVAGIVLAKPLLTLMGVPKEVLPLSVLYMRLYFCGMIPSLVYNFASAVLRSVGDTKRPMYFLTLSGLLNVVLNLIFVMVFNMDVAGVALATALSQAVAATLTIICLIKETGGIKLTLSGLKMSARRLKEVVRIGFPAGLNSSMFSISNVVIQSSLNSFGPEVIAGNGAASSIESLIFTALASISQAVIAFTGQNFGKYDYKRIVRAHLWGQALVYTFGIALCVVAVMFSEPLLSLYADSPAEISAGAERMRVLASSIFIYSSADIAVATMRGMGCSITPTITSVLCICGVRILWVMTVFQIPQFHTVGWLYAAFPVSYALSLIVQMVFMIFMLRIMQKRYPPPTEPSEIGN